MPLACPTALTLAKPATVTIESTLQVTSLSSTKSKPPQSTVVPPLQVSKTTLSSGQLRQCTTKLTLGHVWLCTTPKKPHFGQLSAKRSLFRLGNFWQGWVSGSVIMSVASKTNKKTNKRGRETSFPFGSQVSLQNGFLAFVHFFMHIQPYSILCD